MTARARAHERTFTKLFEPAERELRAVLGGHVSTKQFYGAVAILHQLAEAAARR
jgi:hypothetical protein